LFPFRLFGALIISFESPPLTNNPKSADKRQSQENKKKVKWSAESDGGGGRTTFFDFVYGEVSSYFFFPLKE
jgi:hypothetical protein